MPRLVEQDARRRFLDDAAGIHHGDAIAGLGNDAKVVADQHQRHAHLATHRADEIEDLRLDRDVERGRRLVGDQHVRLAGERHGDHHALILSAGKLVRVSRQAPRRRPECRRGRTAGAPRAGRRFPRARDAAPALRPAAGRSLSTGLSALAGSWKIIATRPPRTRSIVAGARADELGAFEPRAAADRGLAGQQPERGEPGHGLCPNRTRRRDPGPRPCRQQGRRHAEPARRRS